MRLLSLTSIAAGVLATATLTAAAADLPVKAPPVAAPVVDTWTGCYLGGNIGGSWGSGHLEDSFGAITRSGHNSGFAGGGQIGCDFQTGAWVFGIRDMFDWSNRHRSGVIGFGPLAGYGVTVKNNWIDLLTGRIGYAVHPWWLLYFQGGAAWRQNSLQVFAPGGLEVATGGGGTRTGWTVGGGSEWKFAPNWSVFVEYDFAEFGSRSVTVANTFGSDTITAKSNVQMLLIGLNWRPKFF